MLGKQSFYKVFFAINTHFTKVLLGKQSFYKVFSNALYDRLNFHIFAWLGLNPDYIPAVTVNSKLVAAQGFQFPKNGASQGLPVS